MQANADKLPGTYTLALAIDVGLEWTKEVKQISDMEELDTAGRQKAIGKFSFIHKMIKSEKWHQVDKIKQLSVK